MLVPHRTSKEHEEKLFFNIKNSYGFSRCGCQGTTLELAEKLTICVRTRLKSCPDTCSGWIQCLPSPEIILTQFRVFPEGSKAVLFRPCILKYFPTILLLLLLVFPPTLYLGKLPDDDISIVDRYLTGS